MIYKDEVIEYVKFYITRRRNLTKLGIENINREELLIKVCKGIGVKQTNKNINRIREIVNEAFGKVEVNKKIGEETEKKAVEFYNGGLRIIDIVDMLGISSHSLYKILDKHNVKRRGRKKARMTNCDLDDKIVEKVKNTIRLENTSRGLKR